ncbi:MAG: YbgC/FadM family acyl-CoA thioesterase [Bacteroidetes bacterium]|jgi:acyl-CoA thioester hydrolase|nr:YbgC/FadM family acyl-CoA thioesterase [Bacteroidota bacterium]
MIRFPETKPIVRFSYELRSRYGETDQMGYVYYGRYLEYFEVARTEMIRSLGIPYSRLEKDGFMLPVVYAQLEYKAPIHYDELMNIEVSVYEKPMVRLETFYRVRTSRLEKPHVLGQVTLCFTDAENRRPCRAPDYFKDLMDQQS